MKWQDDPFDQIVKEFFGESAVRRSKREDMIENEEEDRSMGFVETAKEAFMLFELPGFNENDVEVFIKDKKVEIHARKKQKENVQDYLAQKLRTGMIIKKNLPSYVDPKQGKHTFRHGILEIRLKKHE